jgi:hypothetical protein
MNSTYIDRDALKTHTITVANQRKTKARSNLETGDVFGVNGKFYVYTEYCGNCHAVCLNAVEIISYAGIPGVVEMFRVTDVEAV